MSQINSNSGAFYKTLSLFRSFISNRQPVSYSVWKTLDEDHKVATLYVQFYKEIQLAWYKCKTIYVDEEDAVSTVLQYLLKNVPIIETEAKRFNPAYIYTISYNCLRPICSRLLKNKLRVEQEISECSVADETSSIFDLTPSVDTIDAELDRKHFWELIQQLDLSDSMLKFIYNLCSSNSKPVYITKDKAKVIKQLQEVLVEYKY